MTDTRIDAFECEDMICVLTFSLCPVSPFSATTSSPSRSLPLSPGSCPARLAKRTRAGNRPTERAAPTPMGRDDEGHGGRNQHGNVFLRSRFIVPPDASERGEWMDMDTARERRRKSGLFNVGCVSAMTYTGR